MKIYELRDITDEEIYYTFGFYSSYERALKEMDFQKGDVRDMSDDFVESAIIEHELDVVSKPNSYGKALLRKQYERVYDTNDDEIWKLVKEINENKGEQNGKRNS